MSQTLDHIKEEIKSLRPAERFDLWRDLGQEFDTSMGESEDGASVEADWDAEIDARVRQVEKGEVELVSADEAIERVRAKLAARRAELTTAA
ncbi:addiction module protein [Prosthecobacter sp.]|uniref:addiction module protein n=1 Tax=Prosthecobacter sp. TaxID=1965333 RepID=UPI003784A194